MFESRISAGALTQKHSRGHTIWSVMRKMRGRLLRTSKQKNGQRYKVSTPCLDDHNFKKEELVKVGDLSTVSSQVVLECLYLARIGRSDIRCSVNKLAGVVTKWTPACDKRLARLMSYNHDTSDHRQYCHFGNTAQHCR